MKVTSPVWLAAATVLIGSQAVLAQQHVHTVVSAECEQCRNGAVCQDPGCSRCRFRLYPDAGWNPPVNLPVNYNWAWYGLSGPQAPYGSPNGGFIAQYPSVYQPTDTAQLGYYYHKVPTWQPQPGRLPGVPVPSHFHSRMCPTNCQGVYSHGTVIHSYGVPAVPQAPEVQEAPEAPQAAPVQGPAPENRAVLAPVPLKQVRPVSSNPERLLDGAADRAAVAAVPETARKPLVTAKPVSRPAATVKKSGPTPKVVPKSAPKSKPAGFLQSLFD